MIWHEATDALKDSLRNWWCRRFRLQQTIKWRNSILRGGYFPGVQAQNVFMGDLWLLEPYILGMFQKILPGWDIWRHACVAGNAVIPKHVGFAAQSQIIKALLIKIASQLMPVQQLFPPPLPPSTRTVPITSALLIYSRCKELARIVNFGGGRGGGDFKPNQCCNIIFQGNIYILAQRFLQRDSATICKILSTWTRTSLRLEEKKDERLRGLRRHPYWWINTI